MLSNPSKVKVSMKQSLRSSISVLFLIFLEIAFELCVLSYIQLYAHMAVELSICLM